MLSSMIVLLISFLFWSCSPEESKPPMPQLQTKSKINEYQEFLQKWSTCQNNDECSQLLGNLYDRLFELDPVEKKEVAKNLHLLFKRQISPAVSFIANNILESLDDNERSNLFSKKDSNNKTVLDLIAENSHNDTNQSDKIHLINSFISKGANINELNTNLQMELLNKTPNFYNKIQNKENIINHIYSNKEKETFKNIKESSPNIEKDFIKYQFSKKSADSISFIKESSSWKIDIKNSFDGFKEIVPSFDLSKKEDCEFLKEITKEFKNSNIENFESNIKEAIKDFSNPKKAENILSDKEIDYKIILGEMYTKSNKEIKEIFDDSVFDKESIDKLLNTIMDDGSSFLSLWLTRKSDENTINMLKKAFDYGADLKVELEGKTLLKHALEGGFLGKEKIKNEIIELLYKNNVPIEPILNEKEFETLLSALYNKKEDLPNVILNIANNDEDLLKVAAHWFLENIKDHDDLAIFNKVHENLNGESRFWFLSYFVEKVIEIDDLKGILQIAKDTKNNLFTFKLFDLYPDQGQLFELIRKKHTKKNEEERIKKLAELLAILKEQHENWGSYTGNTESLLDIYDICGDYALALILLNIKPSHELVNLVIENSDQSSSKNIYMVIEKYLAQNDKEEVKIFLTKNDDGKKWIEYEAKIDGNQNKAEEKISALLFEAGALTTELKTYKINSIIVGLDELQKERKSFDNLYKSLTKDQLSEWLRYILKEDNHNLFKIFYDHQDENIKTELRHLLIETEEEEELIYLLTDYFKYFGITQEEILNAFKFVKFHDDENGYKKYLEDNNLIANKDDSNDHEASSDDKSEDPNIPQDPPKDQSSNDKKEESDDMGFSFFDE